MLLRNVSVAKITLADPWCDPLAKKFQTVTILLRTPGRGGDLASREVTETLQAIGCDEEAGSYYPAHINVLFLMFGGGSAGSARGLRGFCNLESRELFTPERT
jgi:hypothetical protein